MEKISTNGRLVKKPDNGTLDKLARTDALLNQALDRENNKSRPSPIKISKIRQRLLRNKNNELSVITALRKNRFAGKEDIGSYFTLKDLGEEPAAAPVSALDKLKAFFTTGVGSSLIGAGTSALAQKQEAELLKQRAKAAEAERKAYEAAAQAYKPSTSPGIQLTSTTLLVIGGIAAAAAYALSRKGGKKRR